MKWLGKIFNRGVEVEQLPDPAPVVPVPVTYTAEPGIVLVAVFDELAHLTPEQKHTYAYTEARRIVSLAREEIQANKQRSEAALTKANKTPIARIKAAEAMYQKVKAEVK